MSQTKLTSYFKKHAVIYPETFDMKKVNTFTKKENPSEIPLPEKIPNYSNDIEFTEVFQKDIDKNVYTMHFDGCSKGNPGHAGAGSVIYLNNEEVSAKSVYVGDLETNNVAEYTGLLLGLTDALQYNIQYLIVKGDSNLVIKQMKGEYRVKSYDMQTLYKRAKELEKKFKKVDYIHVYRHLNARADELSNQGLEKIIKNKLTFLRL